MTHPNHAATMRVVGNWIGDVVGRLLHRTERADAIVVWSSAGAAREAAIATASVARKLGHECTRSTTVVLLPNGCRVLHVPADYDMVTLRDLPLLSVLAVELTPIPFARVGYLLAKRAPVTHITALP